MVMQRMAQQGLRSRVQGCLVGAVAGDCLGAPYEVTGVPTKNTFEVLNKFFSETRNKEEQKEKLEYTDDTAMARCIAQSLIDNNGKFNSKDLAKKFSAEFVAFPHRGYGPSVISILEKLGKDQEDVFELARRQFDGSGSYGNGGAMRVAPVGLCPEKDFEQMIEMARQSAQLTHSNPLGYNGAILQCCAVHLALHSDPATFDLDAFVDRLVSVMENEAVNDEAKGSPPSQKRPRSDGSDSSVNAEYVSKLKRMKTLLEEDAPPQKVALELGNSIGAHKSVATAIYSFLRCRHPVEGITWSRPLERTVLYAISLDGDTDTIASMAAAIAGAHYGMGEVPPHWMGACEGVDHALGQADCLYDVRFGPQ